MAAEITNFAEQMAIGRVHAQTPLFRHRLKFAQDGIAAMLQAAPRSYVSISFGKQSLCVAHMVYSVAPETPMFFLASDETWMLYDYADVIEQFLALCPIKLTIVQTHRLADAKSWSDSRAAGDQDLQQMCRREDWDGWFWGLAKDESRARKMTTLASYSQHTEHPTIFRYKDGKRRCCPVMHWSINDLAAYIATNQIPMLNIYRKFGLTQRTTARVTKKMLNNQGMALCRATNSRGFREFTNLFPETNVQ